MNEWDPDVMCPDGTQPNPSTLTHRAFDLAQTRGGPNPGFGPAMDLGQVWLIEVRVLANRSEGLANRSEGLGRLAWPIEVRGWAGQPGQ